MIYEFLYRGPTPHNNGQPSWHVVIGEEVTAFGKTEVRTLGPLPPERAAELGYPLSKILGDVADKALNDRDAQKARADQAELDRDVARQDYAEMAAQLKKAQDDKVLAVRAAGDMAVAMNEAHEREAALVARVDELTKSEDLGPSNPMLNKLSFGLLGN